MRVWNDSGNCGHLEINHLQCNERGRPWPSGNISDSGGAQELKEKDLSRTTSDASWLTAKKSHCGFRAKINHSHPTLGRNDRTTRIRGKRSRKSWANVPGTLQRFWSTSTATCVMELPTNSWLTSLKDKDIVKVGYIKRSGILSGGYDIHEWATRQWLEANFPSG